MTIAGERSPFESLERRSSEGLTPWLKELMHHHGIPDSQSETLLESVGSLPAEKGLPEVLRGAESHNYKLGYLVQ